MEQVTKINGMAIKSFGIEKAEHEIAVNRIVENNFGNLLSGGYFLSMPDDELVKNWINQGEDNVPFLSDAVNNGATIYTLWEHIFADAAQPLGDIAVFSED